MHTGTNAMAGHDELLHGASAVQAHLQMRAVIEYEGLGAGQVTSMAAGQQRRETAAGNFVLHQPKRVLVVHRPEDG